MTASITCPACGKTSYHPEDIRHGWCSSCHAYTADRDLDELAEEVQKQRAAAEQLRQAAAYSAAAARRGGTWNPMAQRYAPPPRPKGGLEQARRNLMRDDPQLYAYLEARVAARELKRAGDDASGSIDGYGAANRVYNLAGQWEQKWRGML